MSDAEPDVPRETLEREVAELRARIAQLEPATELLAREIAKLQALHAEARAKRRADTYNAALIAYAVVTCELQRGGYDDHVEYDMDVVYQALHARAKLATELAHGPEEQKG